LYDSSKTYALLKDSVGLVMTAFKAILKDSYSWKILRGIVIEFEHVEADISPYLENLLLF